MNHRTPPIANVLLADVAGMTRDEVVPFYERLIKSNPADEEVVRVNQLILLAAAAVILVET